MIKITRTSFFRFFMSVISTGLSFVLMVFLIELARLYIKTSKGMSAWFALCSMVLIGIGELSFFIFIINYYKNLKENKLFTKFFIVTAIETFLFAIAAFMRLLILLPLYRSAGLPLNMSFEIQHRIAFVGGVVFAVVFTLAAVFYPKEIPDK